MRCLHLPAAALLLASFARAPGAVAGWLSAPWLLLTLLVALLGVLRLGERGGGPVEVAIDAGLVFLAVGGVWTTASRGGIALLGFAEPWVGLTGAHFHFAGLVLPVVTGLGGRAVAGALGTAAALGVAVGVPLVAAGIACRVRTLESLAALALASAALLTVVLLLRLARRTPHRRAALLLAVAAVALGAAMALVAVYATGAWLGRPWLDVPDMLRTHALLNAFGFALPALLGLRGAALPPAPAGMEVLVPWLGDAPAPGVWEARPFGPQLESMNRAVDVDVDGDAHEAELAGEAPGAPRQRGPFGAAAALVLSYRAFPPEVLQGLRAVPSAPVALDGTIRARYRWWPWLHVVFGARVVAVFDDEREGERRTGFT